MIQTTSKYLHLGDLATLVVATEDGDPMPVAYFQGHEQGHRFQGIIPPIDVVPHEQVVRIWARAPDAEQFCEIVELAMNISTDSHRRLHWLYIGLFLENFLCLSIKRAMRGRDSIEEER